jgi:hypothetical protein
MSVAQGELFPESVFVEPTTAMKTGQTAVSQCSFCGLLACISKKVELGQCPACERIDWRWQQLPVGPFKREPAGGQEP